MFKKIDKLVGTSFFWLFFLTFSVVLFILLMVFMSKYFEDLVGKDLGWDVLGELFFYFSMTLVPQALPLAMLLSSLMTFGNLGEHFELTAIKSTGISLVRVLFPLSIFAVVLTFVAFLFNNYIVPEVNLKAYSLMYDVRQKEPTLQFPKKAFYNGMPGWSIRIEDKDEDGERITGLMIYDHTQNRGNTDLITAERGRMKTVRNDRYLMLEVEDGYRYSQKEKLNDKRQLVHGFVRDKFDKARFMFDLSFLTMQETSEDLFRSNRLMKNVSELSYNADSLYKESDSLRFGLSKQTHNYYDYLFRQQLKSKVEIQKDSTSEISNIDIKEETDSAQRTITILPEGKIYKDSIEKAQQNKQKQDSLLLGLGGQPTTAIDSTAKIQRKPKQENQSAFESDDVRQQQQQQYNNKNNNKNKFSNENLISSSNPDSVIARAKARSQEGKYSFDFGPEKWSKASAQTIFDRAVNKTEGLRNYVMSNTERIARYEYEARRTLIEMHKRYTMAVACFIMFLIGAPLGAIIKKGGLGVPVLFSIVFFISYYVMTITGDKWAREELVSVEVGAWAGNAILFAIGLVFLQQARMDSRLFEADIYYVKYMKAKNWVLQKIKRKPIG
ncbi:MAG: LptF/LptG family permease [Bernardetiaceae bacterium]|nr:LptF/LptG family permease [Bernardetiaceae bacterium]